NDLHSLPTRRSSDLLPKPACTVCGSLEIRRKTHLDPRRNVPRPLARQQQPLPRLPDDLREGGVMVVVGVPRDVERFVAGPDGFFGGFQGFRILCTLV